MAAALAGVFPVFQTPFRDDDSIDVDALEAEIEWIHSQEVDGVVMAMVSEVLRLSDAERDQLARLSCELGLPHGPVVLSVGAESTSVAISRARRAEDLGATAVMAIPPTSVSAGPDELFGYYRALLDAVAVPVIIQDASGYVGQPMSIGMQADLLDAYQERVLFKPEAIPIGPRLSALRDATGGRARVFEGSGGISLVDSYRRGIVGTMPGAEVCWAVVALWQALVDDDGDRIDAINGPLSSLISLQTSLDAFVAVEKHLLVRQGVFTSSRVRGPVAYRLDRETAAEVDRLFELLRAVVLA